MLLLASFVAVIAGLPFIAAQTSLYIPGFDPQPVSADVLGVDSQGRTTWALQPGQPTDDTRADSGFSGTITLVEGPDFASLTYVDPAGQFTMGRVCSLSAGLAICTGVAGTETAVETETASPFEVQVGTTAIAVPRPNPSASSTPSIPSIPSPGASSAPLPSGPSQTSESNTSSTSTNSANEKTLASYVAMLLGSTGLVVALM